MLDGSSNLRLFSEFGLSLCKEIEYLDSDPSFWKSFFHLANEQDDSEARKTLEHIYEHGGDLKNEKVDLLLHNEVGFSSDTT